MRVWTSVLLITALVVAPVVVQPQARGTTKTTVDAVYEISIAGWGIARANMQMKMTGDAARGAYDAELFMQPKGVAKIVTAVRTSVSAAGETNRGKVLPTNYRVRAEEIRQPVAVDMKMSQGSVTSLRAVPPLKSLPGRVPVTNAHRRNIVDPLSSGLLPIKSADASDACRNTLEIFDGWTRYNVKLYFKRTENVATSGYNGPVTVCGARWVPVSGHRPAKKEVQYLEQNRALEMSVVPLPEAGVAIPYRVSIGTPNGEILIEPSQMRISSAGV
ncbi:DUF3108 domain-containing protein [Acuticoccus kandeliae]|uniref:DUF3108 domain-containing protein n=1 Tax=Acuticoccus kandeliae TaxID=2073160 RepID=UPI001300966A|nr:DUF3108 domain-containing protein [Acuticoccus kandeliae]